MVSANAAADLLGLFGREQPAGGWKAGKVLSVSPLQVDIGGIVAEGEKLWVNDALLLESLEAEITLPSKDISEKDGTIKRKKPYLQTGDRVLLLSDDDDVFYLLCKVVTA